MEGAVEYYRRNPNKMFGFIEREFGVYLSMGDKSELIQHLESSWHNNDHDAICLDAYMHLQQMGHKSELLDRAVEEGKKWCKEYAEDRLRQSHFIKEHRKNN